MLKRLCCGVSLLLAGVSVQAAPAVNGYLGAPLAFDRHGENFTARGRDYAIDVSGGGARVGVAARTVTLDFAGARKPAAVAGPQLAGKVNYISGKDPRKWQIGLPTYGRVTYPDVYPGIDVVYYGNQEQLEFDLIVKPGADPNAIRMRVGGADKLSLDPAGALRIAGGLRIELPKIYQDINGMRKNVAGHYALASRGEIAFHVDTYDRTRPLVVDPTLVYSSYLGGGIGTATGTSIALDSSHNIFVTGSTQDQSFPVLNAAYPGYSGGNDGFVTKYNPTGTAILYSTYIGGSANDVLNAIAVDGSGNAWVAGNTTSNNFPTVSPVQATFGGNTDAVLIKLSPSGVPLFSTYLGGGAVEQAFGVAVDSNSNAYVTGFTTSNNFSTTTGVVQTAHVGGQDVFVEKFNSSSTPSRVYATILGGTNNDQGLAVAADSAGNAYVTGITDSAAWVPANPGGGAHPAITGSQDAFVAKLNSTGTAVSYFTYFGGGSETSNAIALDSLNNATIGGQTSSAGLATGGAAQTTFGGTVDGFIANLNPTGTAFNYVTYVGGNRGDTVKSLALDGSGNVYIAGSTTSTNLGTVSALQSTIPGTSDTLFQSSNSGANWSTIDSGLSDEVYDVSPDPVTSGTIVVGGAQGIFLTTNNGGTWTQELSSVFFALSLARSPATSTTIYAVAGGGGVHLSTNNGVTWTAPGNVGVGGVSGSVADPGNANIAYAFGSSGVYKTSNGGTTWAAANTGLPGGSNVGAMTTTSDGALYAALSAGIYKSTNQAGSWTSVNGILPISFTSPHMLTASGTTVYVATGNRAIYKTTNGGSSWSATSIPVNRTPVELAAAPGNASVLYTATQEGTIHVSTDGGNTWSSAGTGFPAITFVTIELVVDPRDSTHVFAQLLDNLVTMVGKLNSTGSAFTYLTYLGSEGSGLSRDSSASGIATDGIGDAFVVGTVSSDNFTITQSNALQPLSNNTAAFLSEISDSAAPCSYPPSPQTIVIPAVGFSGPSAVTGGIPIVESTGCTWTAGANQSWAVISGSGTGIGFVDIVSVAANTTGAARTAALTLNGNTYVNITQPDISCTYTLDQSVYPISLAGGTVSAVMTTGAGCPWEVTNFYPAGVSTTTPTGTGSATLSFTVAPNGGTIERDFFLPVGPQWNDTQVHISQGTLQTITFGALSNMPLGTAPFTISATASSGLTVTFGSNTPAVCAVSGATVTLVAAGTCSITASQSGSATYAAAALTRSFTVTPLSTPPTADSVSPAAGFGASQVFTFRYSSVNGSGYLSTVYSLINSSISAAGGCYVYYVQASNAFFMYNDAGTSVTGPLTPGSGGTLSNSQCTLNGTGSSASGSGNTLTVALSINFKPAFAGVQNLYGYAVDNGSGASGWQTFGTWRSAAPASTPPTADSVSPTSSSGTSQVFTFRYSSVNGSGYLSTVYSLINGAFSAAGGCYVYYVPASNAFYLYNDTASSVTGPLTPGSGGTLSNSQCTLNGTGSSASGSGNTLTLALSINFKPAFSGLQSLYGYAIDNGSNASGWQTLGTWHSNTPVSTPPTADSVSPTSGTGTSQVFTFKYSSVNGSGYLSTVYSLINGPLSAAGGCYVYYVPASNAFYMYNDAGTSVTGPLTPGSGGTLSNSQCTLNGTGSSATGSGNTLTLALSLDFKPAFVGLQNVYGYAIDGGASVSNWHTFGTWNSGPPLNTPPTADSVSPTAGTGTSQIFTFKYSSVNGSVYLGTAYNLINSTFSAAGGCYVYYVAASNAFYLYNDAASSVTGPLTPGSGGTLSNSQCTLNGAGSLVAGLGNTLSVVLSINFKPAFAGLQNLYGYAIDNGSNTSGWQTLGTWHSAAPVSTPPTADSVSPAAGTGASQVFTFKYSSVNGSGYLGTVYSLINGAFSAAGGCYVYYVPTSNAFYLYNDTASSVTGPLTPGSGGTLSNSQCTLNGTGSSAAGSGNTLTVALSISFKPAFTGVQNLYGYAIDNGSNTSGWQTLGTWHSAAPVSTPPTADSVSPTSGTGASQVFTFKYSSVNGSGYLGTVYSLINGAFSAAGGCYVYYVPTSNAFYLYNDTASSVTGPLTPGSGGTLSNSQCTLNGTGSSAAGSGNTLTVALSISFKPAFTGVQNLYGYGIDNGSNASGWQALGTWHSSTPVSTPPTADSVSPASGAGTSQVFTFKYSSVNGSGYLSTVYNLINSSFSAAGGCYVYYVPASNAFYLYNDTASSVTGPLTPGSGGTLSNSQCTLNGLGSSATGSGNTLTVALSINFKPAFAGVQNLYGYAVDNGSNVSGWQTLGTWNSTP